ncbi:creatininase family protein [Phytohabitans sp. ZYX-F-186]|uniref:Creatininase family protein n=1 Tax=Phytohabitans maris TaxID=3071409 RepID=A0ABU0ZIZ6_9ACTN|nr:creatininase family protein [Phytohabitans sp. ZYX-F-186]MDQ7906260.1 creatininase family protein [Phytohabitans sp. ZYX-F-186]
MAQMSATAIEAAVAGGAQTAVVVAGSVEQHGPHLPCDTDTVYGTELARRLATRLGSALVAPLIVPGCSDHHLGFGGTFTIGPELLVAQAEAHLRSLGRMGFATVVLTSSHGGNFGPLYEALPHLRAVAAEYGMRLVDVLSLADFVAALRKVPAERGLDQGIPAVQADLIETSIMLYLRPDLVRMDLAEAGHMRPFDIDELFASGLKPLTANGILGDPRGATAELGEAIVAALEEYLVAAVGEKM